MSNGIVLTTIGHIEMNNNDPYKCSLCDEVFIQYSDLQEHVSMHNGGKKTDCLVCRKPFKNSILRGIHLQMHAGELPFKCVQCDVGFSEKSLLEQHIAGHSFGEEYKCTVCGKCLKSTGSFERHMALHRGKVSYNYSTYKDKPVPESTEVVPEPLMLDHITYKGRLILPKSAKVPTEQAKKPFVQQNKMLVQQDSTVSYSCQFCHKRFTRKFNRDVHMKTHDKNQQKDAKKLFECEVCKNKFTRNTNLKKHMKIHSADKRYYCSMCESSFHQRGALVAHMSAHVGSFSQFVCSVCGFGYSSGRALASHKRVHAKQSSETNQAANGGQSATKHVKGESGSKVVSCHLCYMKFDSKFGLYAHMKVHRIKTAKKVLPKSGVKYVEDSPDQNALQTNHHPEMSHPEQSFSIDLDALMEASSDSEQDPVDQLVSGDPNTCFEVSSSSKQDSIVEYNISLKTETPAKPIEALSNEKLFKCFVCDDYFASKDEVLDHLKTHSD